MFQRLYLPSVAGVIGLLATSSVAYAQQLNDDAESSSIGEIIVTATKRATNLQTTSLGITALAGDDLAARQATNLDSLASLAPSVNFGQTTGNARIAIRGIGYDNISVGNESRTAFHVDGVYISRPTAQLSSLYDIERIEIVRGPQGILYGRNATGGAVNIITRTPTGTTEGYVELTGGNYNLIKLNAAVSGPLSDTLSARVATEMVHRGGYGRNTTLGVDIDNQETQAVRGQLRFEPVDTVRMTLSSDYFHEDDRAYGFHFLGIGAPPDSATGFAGVIPRGIAAGGTVASNPRDSASDIMPFNRREIWGIALTTEFSIGAVDVTSVSGYRSSDTEIMTDLDTTSTPITAYNQFEKSEHLSQEVRFAGVYDRGDWMFGVYYFNEDLHGVSRFSVTPPFIAAGPTAFIAQGIANNGYQKTEAFAVFANGSLELTDHVTARAGIRYSTEKKSVREASRVDFSTPWPPFLPLPSNLVTNSKKWDDVSPSITLEYKPNRDLFFYATYSKGFKSGAFNLGTGQPAVQPETINDWEGGVRAEWFDGKLRTNISAFLYDYKNLQVTIVRNTLLFIENAASAKIKGLEGEVKISPTDRFSIEGNLSLLNAKYKAYSSADAARPDLGVLDLSGNKLNQAPNYAFNLAANYQIPTSVGDFELRGEGRWSDKYYFTQFNREYVANPSFAMFNAFLTWKGNSGLYSTIFVRNIANKRVVAAEFVSSGLVGNVLAGSLQPPRTYGATIGYKF